MLNHPYFLLILAPLIWAGNTIAGKLAVGDIAPMTLVLLRWIVALFVLLPFALPQVKKDWAVLKPTLGWFLIYGGFGFALFNILFYVAATYTTAINIALIQAAIPMLILLINWLLFRQALVFAQIVGLLLALVGVLLIVSRGDWLALKTMHFNVGDILMLLAALCYAIYSITLRYRPMVSWLSFIFVSSCVALLVAIPFAAYEIAHAETAVFTSSLKSWLLLLYVGIFASLVAQIAYAKGVSIVGANRAGFAINLIPVFGALMAVIILGEQFYWFHVVGLILVMGGIALSERFAKRLV